MANQEILSRQGHPPPPKGEAGRKAMGRPGSGEGLSQAVVNVKAIP